jgi:hypothetical protein
MGSVVIWSSALLFGAEHRPYQRAVGSNGSANLRAFSTAVWSKQALSELGGYTKRDPLGRRKSGALPSV